MPIDMLIIRPNYDGDKLDQQYYYCYVIIENIIVAINTNN